ncbi:MAG TPA: NUDIX domain-containing protein [Bacteroidota bacterium]|nr:NUDIX domain-containing protein [Bacteroidota bacterium]
MKKSAGLILYRRTKQQLEVLLVHPGGPIWAKRDEGAWSIPKGEISAGEEPLEAAQREFAEELGSSVQGTLLALGSVIQKGGKVVQAWAVEGDLDVSSVKSNTFSMEWPPRSGREQEFPEIDRAAFFSLDEAKCKINPAQILLLDRLREQVH